MQCSNLCFWPLLLVLALGSASAHAQFVPADVGTTVNGYQDDFDGNVLDPAWVVGGESVFSVGGGVLHVTTASGDPNHLLYERAGYDPTRQEVLARVRINDFGTGDPCRAGVGVGVDAASSQGLNLLFRDDGDRHLSFLDDLRSWGPPLSVAWENNQWYWLRLRQDPDADAGGNDVFAKIWKADGSEPEPADWQLVYEYTSSRTVRSGFAGIAASSSGGPLDMDVDYVLIKAAGLPSIAVAPEAIVQIPAAITEQPQSATVAEGSPVSFSAAASGNPHPDLQWYRNDTVIPGATNTAYSMAAASLDDDGATFQLFAKNTVSNVVYSAASSRATLTVQPDRTPPVLVSAGPMGLAQVQVSFSEPIQPTTATNIANYAIQGIGQAASVRQAELDSSGTNVLLSVDGLQEGVTYTLTVTGITDLSRAANPIAPGSSATFAALSFTPATIGTPGLPGMVTPAAGGWDVTAAGGGFGGTADEGQIVYQTRAGDFDLKVRVASLSSVNPWASAGLLARAAADPGAVSAGVLASPSVSGIFFQSRTSTDSKAVLSGSFPVNYPNTWLRLRRAGNQLTGYAGRDGKHWTAVGTVNTALPDTLLVGLSTASADSAQTAKTAFREFGEVTAPATAAIGSVSERPGQSSRLTGLVFSEIMYHPAPRADGKKLEFVELFNSQGTPEDLSGYRLSGDVDYAFPAGTSIPGGGYLVVARSPSDLESVYGLSGVLGPFNQTNNLPNSSGTIRLRNPAGAIFLELQYRNQAPWPLAADGAGHSLVLARPSYGESDSRAWAASDAVGGSPGAVDPVTPGPLRSVVINEFLAHTDDPQPDYIELYNHSNDPVDVSGCVLTDDASTNKFVIPSSTSIAPRGFLVFDQAQLHFSLNAAGETIYLKDPSLTRVLDVVRFGAQENGVACGRYPDGGDEWSRLQSLTPGAPNAPTRPGEVVINELMYAPISGNADDQYVELFNPGNQAVSLAGWRLEDGIDFTFSNQTTIPGGGYLVVAKNSASLLSRYANLSTANTVGDFSGKLAGSGERVALSKPDLLVSTNRSGVVTTNLIHIAVDEVDYRNGGRWGQWSDGGGSSLERIDPRADGRKASNWADSDETAKAPWTTVQATGRLDNGTVGSGADELQVLLQGAGECLIDDVQVLNAQGVNVVSNPSFENDASGWVAEGTEDKSSWESSEGFQSAHSFHVRAVDRGDNEVNRVRTGFAALSANSTATIQAHVRWLKGQPSVLFRFRGCWLEAIGRMDLPPNLGTPGAPNSRAVPNAPPAIDQVVHAPLVPAAGEPVVVTARITDADGVGSAVLNYRVDPSPDYVSVPMRDDGTGGDAVAGDGIYSATIPGQSQGALVAFAVQASDQTPAPATSQFPADAPARECLVRFGESTPAGNFPVYRIWMTQATFNTWTRRNKMNNTPLDVTFVLGNDRVIYNTEALYAGSPYIAPGYSTPTGNRCGYSVTFPSDDRLYGNSDLVLDWPGGHGNESTALQEQMGYWIANRMGLPYSYRYTIRLQVNGVTDMQRGGVFEAINQPAGDFVRAWSPDQPKGDFYKVERAFEFSDGGGLSTDPEPRLQNYTTVGGVKKTSRYRWNWLKRSTPDVNDFTNIFNLVDAANALSPEPYTSQTEALVDMEEWMGILATEHIIVNFDAYGHEIGKNMYAYKPNGGKWQIYMFDLDWLMLAAMLHQSQYAPSTAPLFNADDPLIVRMYNHPPFLRAYYRAIQKAVNGPLLSANCDPIMDAKYQSLVANGVTMCDGRALTDPSAVKNWFSQRHDALAATLARLSAPFAVTSNGGGEFSTNSDRVTLTGSAPIEVKGIQVNGVDFPVTWTSVTNWSIQVVLPPGRNVLALQAVDPSGQAIPNLSTTMDITYTGGANSPVGQVIINEIMATPLVPGSEFIELYNRSANLTFDLSGWRLKGVSFTFPAGTLIAPNGYVVITKDRGAFVSAYGNSIPVAGEFSGTLQPVGETLSLVVPGASAASDVVINTVAYRTTSPWPSPGPGASLQLIDPNQDNSRPANWMVAVSSGQANGQPQWQRVTSVGTASSSILYMYLTSPGDVRIDDVALVAGSTPDAGPNLIPDGDFESGFPASWTVSANLAGSTLDSVTTHSGSASLHLVSSSAGTTRDSSIWANIGPLTDGDTYALSYWYLPSTNGAALTLRLSGSGISSTHDIAPAQAPSILATPGAVNSGRANLPTLSPVRLNEIEPGNLSGPADQAGEHDPWLELFNPSDAAASLDGLFLTDDYTNPTKWAFPAGSSVGPHQFLVVWLDGQPGQTTASELHAGFRVAPGSGSVALVGQIGGQPGVLDFLEYRFVGADRSFGLFPDGQTGSTEIFYVPTPGAPNNDAAAPYPVWINEWMAGNTHTLQDPADGRYDDWFELYNPNAVAVDLTGYALSDSLTNSAARWPIPGGTAIAPHGYLLVWADNEPAQNPGAQGDLHATFKLSKSGETIALFAPNGSVVDSVLYGSQVDDVSQGRWPDGAPEIYSMTTPTPRSANVAGAGPGDLRIQNVSLSGGVLTIRWQAQVGQTYRVQFSDTLASASWTDLTELKATTDSASTTASISNGPHRFYRVVQIAAP